jgi:GH18 family chitinase
MGWQRLFDSVAQSPYLLNGGSGGSLGMIAYDDAASTAQKTHYVLYQRGLGGVFMWELSADYDGKTQDLLNAMYLAWQELATVGTVVNPLPGKRG